MQGKTSYVVRNSEDTRTTSSFVEGKTSLTPQHLEACFPLQRDGTLPPQASQRVLLLSYGALPTKACNLMLVKCGGAINNLWRHSKVLIISCLPRLDTKLEAQL